MDRKQEVYLSHPVYPSRDTVVLKHYYKDDSNPNQIRSIPVLHDEASFSLDELLEILRFFLGGVVGYHIKWTSMDLVQCGFTGKTVYVYNSVVEIVPLNETGQRDEKSKILISRTQTDTPLHPRFVKQPLDDYHYLEGEWDGASRYDHYDNEYVPRVTTEKPTSMHGARTFMLQCGKRQSLYGFKDCLLTELFQIALHVPIWQYKLANKRSPVVPCFRQLTRGFTVERIGGESVSDDFKNIENILNVEVENYIEKALRKSFDHNVGLWKHIYDMLQSCNFSKELIFLIWELGQNLAPPIIETTTEIDGTKKTRIVPDGLVFFSDDKHKYDQAVCHHLLQPRACQSSANIPWERRFIHRNFHNVGKEDLLSGMNDAAADEWIHWLYPHLDEDEF